MDNQTLISIAVILMQVLTVILLIAVLSKISIRDKVFSIKEDKKDETQPASDRLRDAERQQERIRRNYDEAHFGDRNRQQPHSQPQQSFRTDNRDNRGGQHNDNDRNRDRDRNRDNRDRDRNRDNRDRDRNRDRNRDNRQGGGYRNDQNRGAMPPRRPYEEVQRPAPAQQPVSEGLTTPPEAVQPIVMPSPAPAPEVHIPEVHAAEGEFSHGRRPVVKRRPLDENGAETPAPSSENPALSAESAPQQGGSASGNESQQA